jgi:hypothetical protein
MQDKILVGRWHISNQFYELAAFVFKFQKRWAKALPKNEMAIQT